jgi:predicted hotdog family 3-hydroxylacyl-ACP dehydratase
MERADISVEELLPHRGRMMLVDEIIELDEEKAVTRSTVTEHWPFFDGKAVNAIVLIELVAQTAGISNSWGGIKKHGDKFERKGWLVGIKQSRFIAGSVPLNTRLTTRCENQFKLDKYREIVGTVRIGSDVVAEVRLQLIQPDAD